MAKYLKVEAVGIYGLLVASIGFCIYLLGFDFHTYSTREIVSADEQEVGWRVKSHLMWLCLCYILFLPLLYLLFLFNFLPVYIVWWFYALMILEHITAELGRFLIARDLQVVASFTLFIRTGLWSFACVVVMYFIEDMRELDFVLVCWVVGLVVSFFVSLLLSGISEFIRQGGTVKWLWIYKGVKICLPILLATLLVRVVYVSDRYLLGFISDMSIVGVYVFYMTVGAAIVAFLEYGLFNLFFPKMIKAWRLVDKGLYAELLGKLKFYFYLYSFFLMTFTFFFVKITVYFYIKKQLYLDNFRVIYFAIFSSFMLAWAMVYYYDLYCRNQDGCILKARLYGCMMFFICFWLFGVLDPLDRVLLSVCASATTLMLSGYMYSKKTIGDAGAHSD